MIVKVNKMSQKLEKEKVIILADINEMLEKEKRICEEIQSLMIQE